MHGNKMYVCLTAGTGREMSVVYINKEVSFEHNSTFISQIISCTLIQNSHRPEKYTALILAGRKNNIVHGRSKIIRQC